jgi:L-fuconolactonase
VAGDSRLTEHGGRVIDAHHHLWRLEPGRTVWPAPDDGPLYRSFGWGDLEPELDAAGVSATVVVQTADSDEDTDFLLDAARGNPRIAGVVGWLPLHDPAIAAARLDVLRADPAFVGVRCLIHRIGDDDWLARADVDRGFALLERDGIPYDVVSDRPRQLRHVATVAARHPGLPLVIDHLSKPPIGRADHSEWRVALARAAEHPNVFGKLSGLYPAVGDPTVWSRETLRPFVEQALELFEADRLMLGSDWPVCVVAGGYARVWTALREFVDELSPTERDHLLGGTAVRFYRLAE